MDDDPPYRQPRQERRLASAAEVLRRLENGEIIRSLRVDEALDLRRLGDGSDYVRTPIRFVDCRLGHVDISFSYYEEPVAFAGCSVGSLLGMAGYFFAGFTLERCEIGPVDLSCGGHNRLGHAVVLSDTKFDGFVSFSDSWYEGPVRVQRCNFTDGTNLLNGEQLCPVRFDFAPVIDDNIGELAAPERAFAIPDIMPAPPPRSRR